MTDDTRAISKIYERDMDLVLVEELESSAEFRAWLVARVFGRDCYLRHLGTQHSVVDQSNRESDVVFRFIADESGAESTKAILIENKIDAIAQPNQGRDYRVRGQTGTDRNDWSEFKTCLIAPRQYKEGERTQDWRHFDEVVTYEEILAFFASRKARDERYAWKTRLVETALFKKASGYTPVISEEATAFVEHYHALAQAFPRLEMALPKPRPAGNTWISFRPSALPKGTAIEHQVTAGWVKLMFHGAVDRLDALRDRLAPFLDPRMTIEQAGKSVSVAVQVPVIPSITMPFSDVAAQAEEGMRAADRLVAMIEAARAGGVRF
jgi:hypothetical protein